MLIRALDLKAQTVKTIAGTGKQGLEKFKGGSPLTIGLNSPWGLYVQDNKLWIAMAGHHQIWTLGLNGGGLYPFAGNGNEELKDGPRATCIMAQPSGLGSDGTTLYIADSESSSIRALPMDPAKAVMRTVIGKGLFFWGDKEGSLDETLVQHPLDVVFHKGKLYLTDTYNHKIKVIDLKSRVCSTLEVEESGETKGAAFDEPAGLSIAGEKLYVADTNAHRIRVVDLETKRVSTLVLSGVQVP
jgi:DNA-binding beta-propeller fold protein YncE